jgi:cardiolipin synthase
MLKFLKKIINRFTIVSLALILQIAFLFVLSTRFSDSVFQINIGMRIFSILVMCLMLNTSANPAIKLAWMALILISPIFGSVVYLLTGGKRPAKKLRKACEKSLKEAEKYTPNSPEALLKLKSESSVNYTQAKYLQNLNFPVYENTDVKYFPLGDDVFPIMLEELEKAEKFIFIEYFIVAKGEMHDKIMEILERKAKSGVEVRFIYDDVGSLFTLPYGYEKTLEAKGIKCHAFNPFVPVLSAVMNNRDHRKIIVIDSKVAFTGGINIADEYINKIEKYGHWKDNALMLRGNGVWGFTLMFLSMWNAFRPEGDYEKFLPEGGFKAETHGYVQPFCDSPLDDELVAENVYISAINAAQKYIYIYTPYLIPDHEMTSALCLAAKKGVDVKIVVPGIPDKKIAYSFTKSYYGSLIRAGVKIYKYNPGFVHAKGFVSDDCIACGGTVNLDFRSLYHHFECGCVTYHSPEVLEMKKDILETIEKCERVENYQKFKGLIGSTYHAVLRLIAPLM